MNNPRSSPLPNRNHILDRLAIEAVTYFIAMGVWLEHQLGLAPKKLIPLKVKSQ